MCVFARRQQAPECQRLRWESARARSICTVASSPARRLGYLRSKLVPLPGRLQTNNSPPPPNVGRRTLARAALSRSMLSNQRDKNSVGQIESTRPPARSLAIPLRQVVQALVLFLANPGWLNGCPLAVAVAAAVSGCTRKRRAHQVLIGRAGWRRQWLARATKLAWPPLKGQASLI